MTTAAEVIEMLSKLPPETLVMTRGYEGGYCDAELTGKVVQMTLDVNDAWYYGPHDLIDSYRVGYKAASAVVL